MNFICTISIHCTCMWRKHQPNNYSICWCGIKLFAAHIKSNTFYDMLSKMLSSPNDIFFGWGSTENWICFQKMFFYVKLSMTAKLIQSGVSNQNYRPFYNLKLDQQVKTLKIYSAKVLRGCKPAKSRGIITFERKKTHTNKQCVS